MLSKLLDGIDTFSEWVGKTASWLCLAMIFVLVYEVMSRYIANRPTEWANETTTMLYGTFCMVGAVWTLRDKGHVRSEVVYQMLSPKMKLALDVFCGVLVMVMLAVFFYVAFDFALESWKSKETSSKSTWGVAIYPFKTVIPVVVFLMFFQQLAHTIRDIAALFGHRIYKETILIQD